MIAGVDGTPSLTTRTVAPASATSPGPGPGVWTTVPVIAAPASSRSATPGDQFANRRGARPGTDGTTSTEYSPVTSWAAAAPEASENASTIAPGIALGENCRYAGTPPVGPSTATATSRPDSTEIAPRSAAPPPLTSRRRSSGGAGVPRGGTICSRTVSSSAPGASMLTGTTAGVHPGSASVMT